MRTIALGPEQAGRLKFATRRLIEKIGGLKNAVALDGRSDTTFSEYQAGACASFMPIDAVAALEADAGEPVVTRALADLVGFDLVPRSREIPALDPAACLRRLTADLGDIAREEDRARAHGHRSANDRRTLLRELHDLIDTANAMIASVEPPAPHAATEGKGR